MNSTKAKKEFERIFSRFCSSRRENLKHFTANRHMFAVKKLTYQKVFNEAFGFEVDKLLITIREVGGEIPCGKYRDREFYCFPYWGIVKGGSQRLQFKFKEKNGTVVEETLEKGLKEAAFYNGYKQKEIFLLED